jgi:rubrerythrin
VGAGRPAAPRSDRVWRCSGCGTIWEHEPLPDEAL